MIDHLYHYRATVTGVYDGDTCTLRIDLGLSTERTEKVRLYRINAPEVRGAERNRGLAARDALRGLVLGKEVVVRTYKDKKGKYGRYLADIHIGTLCVNDWLVENGHAIYKEY